MPQEFKFRNVSHCIFDLDGLLIDSEIRFSTSLAIVLKRFGHEYSLATQEAVLGLEPARGLQMIIDTYNLPITVEEFKKLEKEVYVHEMENVQLMPGAERVSFKQKALVKIYLV